MKCQEVSWILDTREMGALSTDERRDCEVHSASCPDCGPDWIVYTRLSAISTPPMPQALTERCQNMAEVQLKYTSHRPRARIVLMSAILVVAAAATMLVALRTSEPPREEGVRASIPVANRSASIAASATLVKDGTVADAAVQPVTVLLLLDQALAGDAIGRDYGNRVYERARDELRALPGVVLVEAGAAETAVPAYRLNYINMAKSDRGVTGQGVQVEMVFTVEAFQPDANGTDSYRIVFNTAPPPSDIVDMPPSVRQKLILSFRQEPSSLMSSVRRSARPAVKPVVPADCIDRRESHCPYTPADIAAFTILSWHLETTSPDPLLVERLHAMLRDSSTPQGLWLTALVNLHKYGKLRLDLPEHLAALGRLPDNDPALGEELMSDALKLGSRYDLMRNVREFLLSRPSDARRPASSALRQRLVQLLSTELRNEPDARSILESVAAADPEFDVRATARRALGMEQEPQPEPRPAASYMGPINEQ